MKKQVRPFRWTDAILILVVIALPHAASLPMFIYPPLLTLVVWVYLRHHKETFSDIGFRFGDLTPRSFVVGCGIGVAWAALLYFFLGPLILKVTGLPPADLSDFEKIKNNTGQFIALLAIAWLVVIPYEEIMFRGLILSLLRGLFGDTNRGFWIAGLVQCVLFAAYHYQEGGSAVISIFLGAILTIALYKRFNGNLWYLIFFHAAYDTVMLTLFRYGHL